MNEWWIYILLVVSILISYLVTTAIDRAYNPFRKISSWIIIPLPFLVMFIIGIPMLLVQPKIEFNIIFYSVAFPTMVFLGFSTAIFLERWTKWRERKLAKAQEAQGNHRHNKKKEK